jgi:hypothetical protein
VAAQTGPTCDAASFTAQTGSSTRNAGASLAAQTDATGRAAASMAAQTGATGKAAASIGAQAGAARKAAASMAAQTGATRNRGSRGLRRRVSAQCGAVTAQDVGAAFATDAESSAAGATSTSLTTDADTPERARHVRSSSTIHRSAFTSDQPRLTARAGTQRCAAAHSGGPADIARASQSSACGKTGLIGQTATASQAAASSKTPLAG